MKKVRNIRWHTVLIDTLKTETSNFVLNPCLHWKPVECSQECCCETILDNHLRTQTSNIDYSFTAILHFKFAFIGPLSICRSKAYNLQSSVKTEQQHLALGYWRQPSHVQDCSLKGNCELYQSILF